MEHLREIQINNISFNYEMVVINLPNSPTKVGLLKISGIFDALNWKILICKIQEAVEIPIADSNSVDGLIIDFSETNFASLDKLNATTIKKKKWHIFFAIVPEEFQLFFSEKFPQIDGYALDHSDAISKIAFAYRNERYDGGKNFVVNQNSNLFMKSKTVSFEISKLRMIFYLWKIKSNQKIALVQIEGSYGLGSSGYKDALYISWQLRLLSISVNYSDLIIDLRKFNYVWGDDLNLPSNNYTKYVIEPEQFEQIRHTIAKESCFFDMNQLLVEIKNNAQNQ